MALAAAMGKTAKPVIGKPGQLWKDWMGLWEATARRILGGEADSVVQPAPGDRRFRDAEWQRSEIFDFIKQSYLLTANAMQAMVADLNDVPDADEASGTYQAIRGRFYADQFSAHQSRDARRLSPTAKIDVKGLDNLIADIERGHGELAIRQSADSFELGKNIATAPGSGVLWADRAFAVRAHHRRSP